MPKVSVIIPIYNTEKYLRKCLDSVCNQTLSDIEIICVNDCSTDNSLEILEEYASKDNRIKLIDFKENKGAAVARNAGIDEAKGEYIGFVDSDDFIDLDFYEKLYNKAIETGADVTKSNLIFENFCNEDNKKEYHNLQEVRINKLYLNHIPTTLIKKSFLTNNKIAFPEILKNAEDSVFEVMVGAKANKIEIVGSVFYHYNYNNLSLNNTEIYSKEKIKNLLLSFEKNIDYINQIEISSQCYQEFISHRFNVLIRTILEKCDGNIDIINILEENLKILKNKFKYALLFDESNKISILKKIIKSRNANVNNINVIPKRIFYVWFGDKKTTLANVCIDNWREKLPDFEIIEVGKFSSYFDFEYEYNNCKWFKDVYDRKLWAFVSDYVRTKVLYEYGGIYLDTDITIKKDLSPLLKHNFFIGEESVSRIGVGIFGSKAKHPYLEKVLRFYQNKIYNSPLYIIPDIYTEIYENGNLEDVYVYKTEAFYPFKYQTEYKPECITQNTYTVHWWNASWINSSNLSFLRNKHHLAALRKRTLKQ